ncbi:hypothetical protein EDEG_03631 [Edhazardia aedis USNM 41457]|uniref:Uncharacterized protein n=1 Tax=Edhazardia aedis (strain USNM 41457) TaxID=1003232 RepID=J8ZQB7_EDHAE|nr:hypothetical protein EDEG_03631 [Edhazardia aedis USNM 41457]|eukprot:EJW01888.1 hypothetical protein EDEG_03631 [Edhazardia aedis USNM 41457]
MMKSENASVRKKRKRSRARRKKTIPDISKMTLCPKLPNDKIYIENTSVDKGKTKEAVKDKIIASRCELNKKMKVISKIDVVEEELKTYVRSKRTLEIAKFLTQMSLMP